MKATKTRKRKLKQRTRGSNKLQGRRTVKSRIRGGVKRPLSLLNIDDINTGYTENKPMAKAAAIDDFILGMDEGKMLRQSGDLAWAARSDSA